VTAKKKRLPPMGGLSTAAPPQRATDDAPGAAVLTNYSKAVVITIAVSTTVSAAVDLLGFTLVGLILPAAFTGTAITFQVSDSLAGTYVPLRDATGAAVSVTVAQGTAAVLDPTTFAGWRFVKLVSGSAEAADRTVKLALRAM
jgi:hypothetical protein